MRRLSLWKQNETKAPAYGNHIPCAVHTMLNMNNNQVLRFSPRGLEPGKELKREILSLLLVFLVTRVL